MKILAILATLLFAVNSFAAPLVFKATKEIKSPDKHIELATVDTSKYSRLRFHIVHADQVSQFYLWAHFVEDGIENYWIQTNSHGSYTSSIDLPPSQIKFMVKGSGTFRIYIWAVE